MHQRSFIPFLLLLLLSACSPRVNRDTDVDYRSMDHRTRAAYKRVDRFLKESIRTGEPVALSRHTRIDTILVDRSAGSLDIQFNDWFGTIPLREENVAVLYESIRRSLGNTFSRYDVLIRSGGFPIEDLIPNAYRKRNLDRSRMPGPREEIPALVRPVSVLPPPDRGLAGRHIALWHSHGWYYEQSLDRWEWQRARVFQTVEDLLPMSFTVPYLIPMLENAGANVLLPRERDLQTRMVIIDNDGNSGQGQYAEKSNSAIPWQDLPDPAFAVGNPPYVSGDNPFHQGTARTTETDTAATAQATWIPDIPASGRYAVYIAYAATDENVTDAMYTVIHRGGSSAFRVNQRMGAGTWIYLGTFAFDAGQDPTRGAVELSNRSREKGVVVADGVRFGGGMGDIARNGKVSGKPRYAEAARYYLQFAGIPDTLVYNLNADESDYRDDYQCRGEWVNYLRGAPRGPNLDRSAPGLHIPIDLSLAFHTDAGFTRNDTVIGTLAIYSTEGGDSTNFFPDGMSRLANRDFADILQTQLVQDIRKSWDPGWTRRMLWDRGYSEAYRPNVPSALLELLSHHNFFDMRFALDPGFRFDVSRSIYKAILRFLATQDQIPYVVQPLPVDHLSAEFQGDGGILLRWQPVLDPLEPSAEPDGFLVYTRINDGEFDRGTRVQETEYTLPEVESGLIYSFRVTALNRGGESFPSEVMSACRVGDGADPVLIINAFDRVSPPATLESDKYLGFANFWDQGVPDGYDFNYIGAQYDFLADSPWLDDDAPGHGASFSDFEDRIVAGNTHDFVIVHGRAIRNAGRSFVSASDEAVMDWQVDATTYSTLDLVCGEERTTTGPRENERRDFTIFPPALQGVLSQVKETGGDLFVSGAYVGSDLAVSDRDSTAIRFGEEILGIRFRTDHAVNSGGLLAVDEQFLGASPGLSFVTSLNDSLYAVESPDAIEPADSTGRTILRYAGNNTSAAVVSLHNGKTVVLGFPFESLTTPSDRDRLMRAVLREFQTGDR